jgi:DNA-binding NtrC family response regulator
VPTISAALLAQRLRRLRGLLRREPKVVEPKSILVVDSNADDRQSTVRCVERLGYEALEAANVEDALRQLETRAPELVLLAFDLSGASGLEALGQVRELDPNLPVIMLTADWRDSRTVEAMRRGAIAYLAKPFSQDDLRELVPKH